MWCIEVSSYCYCHRINPVSRHFYDPEKNKNRDHCEGRCGNPEMVQVMGHNIYRYFTGVFAAGLPWLLSVEGCGATFRQIDTPRMGGKSLFRLDRGHHRRPWKHDRFEWWDPNGGLSYNYVAYLVPKQPLELRCCFS